MKVEDFFSRANAYVGVAAPDKMRLLADLSGRAAASLNLDGATVTREVLKREGLGSTGTGGGIALPHARLQNLDKPFGLLALLKRPLEFEAIDGQPVDLVFLLLRPAAAQGDLNALAAVARVLRESDRLARLRNAADSDALYRAMTS